MPQRKSNHILSTASNLLGFAFFILTSVRGFGLPQNSVIDLDKTVAVLIVLLAASCAFSFASIRADGNVVRSARYEAVADYLFLAALGIIVIVSLVLGFDVFFFLN